MQPRLSEFPRGSSVCQIALRFDLITRPGIAALLHLERALEPQWGRN